MMLNMFRVSRADMNNLASFEQHTEISTRSPFPKFAVEVPNRRNWNAIADLEQERDELMIPMLGYGVATGVIVAALAGTGFSGLGLPFIAPAYNLFMQILEILQIRDITKALVEKFEDRGIEVFPRTSLEDAGTIDLYLRFPTRKYLMVALQGIGNNNVHYSPIKNILYLKNKNGKTRDLKRDKLDVLIHQQITLRKKHRDLMGGNSRDTKHPIARVICLCGKGQIQPDFPKFLKRKIGDMTVSTIDIPGVLYIVMDKNIVEFVEAWISQH